MKIEQFIAENREALDNYPLPKDHERQMRERLNNRPGRTHRLKVAILLAAVAASIAIAVFVLKPTPDIVPLTPQEIELAELNEYYQMQMEQSLDSIEVLLKNKNGVLQREIKTQIAEITGAEYDTLPRMLLTIDAEKYLAFTVRRFEMQNDNLTTLINILKQ